MTKYVTVITTDTAIITRAHTFSMPDDFDESTLPTPSMARMVSFENEILPMLQEVGKYGPTLDGTEVLDTEYAMEELVREYEVEMHGGE